MNYACSSPNLITLGNVMKILLSQRIKIHTMLLFQLAPPLQSSQCIQGLNHEGGKEQQDKRLLSSSRGFLPATTTAATSSY